MPDATQFAEQYQGLELVDGRGQTLGTVQSLWVDTATNEPEFVAVKVGRMGRTHVVPVTGLQPTSGQLRVPYSRDQIGGAPHLDETAELSEADEARIYRHYGVERSEAPSPTGLAAGGTDTTRVTDTDRVERTGATRERGMTGGMRSNRIILNEEHLVARKVEEQAGRVEVGTRLVEQEQAIDVPVREERVMIERTPVQGEAHTGEVIGTDETIAVPVTRERVVVEKATAATEEVNVRTEAVEHVEHIRGTVRREELMVDQEGNVQVSGDTDRGTNAMRDTDAVRGPDARDINQRGRSRR